MIGPRPLPAVTKTFVFSSMGSVPPSSAVVGRLRAAVGVGLLEHGDQLPSETELSKQFGVSVFALREALAVLREQGLIVTRPGRNGGSFIQRPTDDAGSWIDDHLVHVSAADLRDWDDWRAMLAGASAALAARRASVENVVRLRDYAKRLGDATSGSDSRRLHGRFHVELAAAAQSTRMSLAELRMHEEFDWLLGSTLADPARRRGSARDLRDIADAIEAHDPDTARLAAERYSHNAVDSLVRLRLRAIVRAEGPDDGPDGHDPHAAQDAAAIATDAWMVLAEVSNVVVEVATLAAEALRRDGVREALNSISGFTEATLRRLNGPVHGLGVLGELDALPGCTYWAQWWLKRQDGTVTPHEHNLDPRRDDFYEYTTAPWMATPREHGGPALVGPYVDYGGTNDYTLTLAHPVLVDGRFMGVAAADLLVSELERRWAPHLLRLEAPSAILNGEQRVVVSNSGGYPVGTLVADVGGRFVECGDMGWSVLTAPVGSA